MRHVPSIPPLDQGTVRDPASSNDRVCGEPDEEDEPEEELRAKGKARRKIPSDIRIIPVDHYPADMTCCTCDCQMKTIKSEERVGSCELVPKHIVLRRDFYHTCSCNRGNCKDNKPAAAIATKHIMKGRGVEVGPVVEAACQKFFKSTATYRMERGLCVETHQSLVGSGLQNLCHQTR